MKNLKKLFGILSIIFIFTSLLYSQEIREGEFMIVNNTGQIFIKAVIYPVGAIFSGGGQYTVDATYPIVQNTNDKIFGKEIVLDFNQNEKWFIVANFDKTEERVGCDFSLGYGIYKIDFYFGPNSENQFIFADSCYVDFSDANFGTGNFNGYQKLRIDYYMDDIKFSFIGQGSVEHSIADVNRHIKVWEQYGTPNPPVTPNKGNFNDTCISQYQSFPINAKDFGAPDHKCPNDIYMNLQLKYQGDNVKQNQVLNFNDCKLKINEGITLTINPTTELNIIGSNGKLETHPNSQLVCPSNFQLNIKNGATINSSYTTFQPSNGPIWNGINMENPGNTEFSHCTFNNAKTSIYSINSYNSNIIIHNNNTFNVPISLGIQPKAVQIINGKNILIDGNYFNLPQLNEYSEEDGIWIEKASSNEDESNNSIIIQYNEFNGGGLHIALKGLLDNFLPVYLNNNIFGNSICNIATNNVSLDSKKNYFNNNNSIFGDFFPSINIYSSNANFQEEEINSTFRNLYIISNSFVNSAPYTNTINELMIVGGKNKYYSYSSSNIGLSSNSYINTDWGYNEFTINKPTFFHLYGNLPDTVLTYYTNGNCWYGNNGEPKINLINSYGTIPYVWEEGANQCNTSQQLAYSIISDKGFGISDTIAVVQTNGLNQASVDHKLLGDGIKNQLLKNYEPAISNFKNIIDNYPDSKYLQKSLYNIYECYVKIDSSENQAIRNNLFNQLKSYLINKIQQYQLNNSFVELAYDLILKCEVKIKNYITARDGFEFISLNSPYPERRLKASWDYMLINERIQNNNSGSGSSLYIQKLKNDDPIKKILTKSYKKVESDKKISMNNDILNSTDKEMKKKIYKAEENYEKEMKKIALFNIKEGSNLIEKNIYKKIDEDFKMMIKKNSSNKYSENIKANIINQFSLSQNYPNPFNPITNIKYQIQKAGLVTLKMYDITGREIKTLVNEIKNPGIYIVTFNGSEFASGVYFYRIQAGDFIQVKKMVLLK